MEQTDQEITFQRRTIPPLPQLTNGGPSSPPPEGEWQKVDLGYTDKELEKEDEAEEEFQQEMVRSAIHTDNSVLHGNDSAYSGMIIGIAV
jgi:hypothetical protein